jgi:hypothetical protein
LKKNKLQNQGDEFEVESIVGTRVLNNNRYYQVKWLNYGNEHNKWLPVTELNNCADLVKEFELNL